MGSTTQRGTQLAVGIFGNCSPLGLIELQVCKLTLLDVALYFKGLVDQAGATICRHHTLIHRLWLGVIRHGLLGFRCGGERFVDPWRNHAEGLRRWLTAAALAQCHRYRRACALIAQSAFHDFSGSLGLLERLIQRISLGLLLAPDLALIPLELLVFIVPLALVFYVTLLEIAGTAPARNAMIGLAMCSPAIPQAHTNGLGARYETTVPRRFQGGMELVSVYGHECRAS
ncbi:hypothetical protein [Comamonas sp. wu1-DMT]|uniref:hypothetical protein n=1 Tax=Comamonas sp. wu1-DMT TaxID=3126390 RepID=UPI0032E4389A